MTGLSAVLVSRPRLVISIFYTSKISPLLARCLEAGCFLSKKSGKKRKGNSKAVSTAGLGCGFVDTSGFLLQDPSVTWPLQALLPPD